MVSLTALWLPIVLSAVIVFVASSVIHMMLPYHRSDWKKVPDEDGVMETLRKFDIPPGDYVIPCAETPAQLKDEAFRQKAAEGPVIFGTVLPKGDPFRMGAQLTQWFIYCLFVSLFAGYIASRAVAPGDDYLHVFRFAGAAAFAAYGLAHLQRSIWYKQAWSTTFKNVFDGLIYGLLTAGTFGWLWPS